MNRQPVNLMCGHYYPVNTLTTTIAALVEDGTKTELWCGECIATSEIDRGCLRCGHPKSCHVMFGSGCTATAGGGRGCTCMGYQRRPQPVERG